MRQCRAGPGNRDALRQPGLCLVEVSLGDSQVSSDPVKGSCGQIAIAVPRDGRLPAVGRFTHISWDPSACRWKLQPRVSNFLRSSL